MTMIGRRSPWGIIDDAEERFDGFVEVGTPSHGGIWLSEQLRALMPRGLRLAWWEEDCAWAVPYYVFRERLAATGNTYVTTNLAQVVETIRRWQPADVIAALGLDESETRKENGMRDIRDRWYDQQPEPKAAVETPEPDVEETPASSDTPEPEGCRTTVNRALGLLKR